MVEIDQSGKIEQTSLNTVIALSNKIKFTLLLPKKIKRVLQDFFRKQGRPRAFVYVTFAALVAKLLYEAQPKTLVIIDDEYTGHQDILGKEIVEFLHQMKVKRMPEFKFGLVGKSSAAHELAAKVAYKKVKADRVVTLEEMIEVIFR